MILCRLAKLVLISSCWRYSREPCGAPSWTTSRRHGWRCCWSHSIVGGVVGVTVGAVVGDIVGSLVGLLVGAIVGDRVLGDRGVIRLSQAGDVTCIVEEPLWKAAEVAGFSAKSRATTQAGT